MKPDHVPDASLGPRASSPAGRQDGHSPRESQHRAWHHRGYLPHFDAGAVAQMITFRLADSLPRDVYDKISAQALEDPERRRRFEEMMDSGRGACVLRSSGAAAIVEQSLRHFDGQRYRLLSWVIMPNHVHVLIEQIQGCLLSDVIRGWKSYTAKEINRLRKTSGGVWAPDYFDRFIRNREHFGNAIAYIENNPVAAGLVNRAEEWPYSSAAENAGGTPAVPGMI